MKRFFYLTLALFFINSLAFGQSYIDGVYAKDSVSTFHGLDKTYEVESIKPYTGKAKKAKNIILLVGDGMGTSQVFSAIASNDVTYFEQFTNIGFSKTKSASSFTTDSAAGATAIATGTKTYNGAISVDVDKKPLKTILEISEDNNKATGLVSTSAITHATPAAFISHQPSRKMYEEIAYDFLSTDIEVFIGGGMDNFKSRKDGKDLTIELEKSGYKVVDNIEGIQEVKKGKLAALVTPSHPKTYMERGELIVPGTIKAIEILNQNKKGFFLMVEASQIDWGGHGNDTKYLVEETADFDRAVGEALKFAAEDGNTLVIVTADHETGGFAVKGRNENNEVEGQFTTGGHTATMVPVFSYGPGAENFKGIYENTELFHKMFEAFGFKK